MHALLLELSLTFSLPLNVAETEPVFAYATNFITTDASGSIVVGLCCLAKKPPVTKLLETTPTTALELYFELRKSLYSS